MSSSAPTALARFGVSLEADLLARFDRSLASKGYANRSEAFRELIRKERSEEEWQGKEEVAGVITLVYDHHRRELLSRLAHAQHEHGGVVASSQHIHLNHHNCLEVLAVRGRPSEIQSLFKTLRSFKGIKQSSLTALSTGERLP